MGGRIWAESAPGNGSCFNFTLPCQAVAVQRAVVEVSDEPAAGAPNPQLPPPLQILLAEDNDVNRTLATRILEKEGHSVVYVQDGQEALETLAQYGGFDLILMDLQMPRMGGFEATKAIRESERSSGRPRIPIIALTAHAMKGDEERCLAEGMDDYVSKPINRSVLFEKLAKWSVKAKKNAAPDLSAV